jgi:prepilin-type N-terminal cleavage/methylation domain-containing protein
VLQRNGPEREIARGRVPESGTVMTLALAAADYGSCFPVDPRFSCRGIHALIHAACLPSWCPKKEDGTVAKVERGAFTLIELLVVVVAIAIQAVILFPVFAQIRDKGRQSVCMTHLRQVAIGMLLYCDDHDDALPSSWPARGASRCALRKSGRGASGVI